MPPTGKASASPKPKKAKPAAEAPIIEPLREVRAVGDNAITVEYAKQLLGWTEESTPGEFGEEFLLEHADKKIRCIRNMTNRPLTLNKVGELTQTILKRRWKYNGEPIIVGAQGTLLNGQHSLISLIMADHRRGGEEKDHWKSYWKPSEPTVIDKLIVFGVEESDDIINTMDTCKPRSLEDVLSRSKYFKSMGKGQKRLATKAMSHAVRLIWYRTGAKLDAFAPYPSVDELLSFLERHPRLDKMVKHVLSEDSAGKLSKYIPTGWLSGMMYLAACSGSERKIYLEQSRVEKALDLERWNKAEQFVIALGTGDTASNFRDSIAETYNASIGMGGTRDERLNVLVKYWRQFFAEEAPSRAILEYLTDSEGKRRISALEVLGGIDIGSPHNPETDDEEDEEIPTPEQVQETIETIQSKNIAPPKPKTMVERLVEMRAKHPDTLLLFRASKGAKILAYGGDATDLVSLKVAQLTPMIDGLKRAQFEMGNLPKVEALLKKERVKYLVLGS